MGLKKGSSAIEESIKKDQNFRVFGNKPRYMETMKDNDVTYLRFITDATDWCKTKQHSYARTKPAPRHVKADKWPKGAKLICRKDHDLAPDYPGGCYACTNKILNGQRNEVEKAVPRVWALAVVREQVIGDGSEKLGGEPFRGKLRGFKDAAEEYAILDDKGEDTGETGVRPKLVIVNMAWKNFYAKLHNFKLMYLTACDRDYRIRRVGDGTDTDYHIVPADPSPDLMPGTEGWQRYEQMLVDRKVDLDAIIMELVSDEHIAKYFDPTKDLDYDGKIVPAGTVEPRESKESKTAGSSDMDASFTPVGGSAEVTDPEEQRRLASLRNRLEGGASAPAPVAS